MPKTQIFSGPKRQNRKFRVKATGETGSALSQDHGSTNVGRYVTIGEELNVTVIDISLGDRGSPHLPPGVSETGH